jgi:hypothetical protein
MCAGTFVQENDNFHLLTFLICVHAGLAQGGWGCCCYCHNLLAFFHEVEWLIKVEDQTVPHPQRRGNYWSVYDDHVTALNDSKSRVRGKVGPADEKIKVNRWAQHVSPFWDLLWMQASFYDCFGICLLHIKHLGLLKVLFFVHPLSQLNVWLTTLSCSQRHL